MAIEILTDKQKNLLDRIKNEGYKIGHLIGYDDLTEFHSKLIKEIVCGKENTSYCIHRGAYTTSAVCLGVALLMLVKPHLKILLRTKSDNEAKERIAKIENILKSDTFQAFSHILYGHGFILKANSSFRLETNLSTKLHLSYLKAVGLRGSIIGTECDVVIADNIVNMQDGVSSAERDFTIDSFKENFYTLNHKGRCLLFGSTWGYDDLYSTLDNVQVFDCYDTGLLTEDKIKEIKLSITPALFSAHYLCNPCKEIYTKGNQAKLEKLASKMYRLFFKNEDISDIKAEMQEIIDNCEIIYRYDNRRKL